jgi:Tfp pilus assembly protein PilO
VNRLSEKQLLILTIGIAVLLTGGLGFLIWSDLQAIEEEDGRIADLRTQISAAEAEIALRPQREFRVIANREISDREVAFLPEETEIENFWEVLERFAEESGVRISEISTNTARSSRRTKGKKSTIQSVPQILSLRGTVEEFLRFINLVENYDRIINVVEYSLTGGEVQDEDGRIRHSMKLALTTFTYSKKIASTIVSIPSYEKKKEHSSVKQWLSKIKIQEKQTYTLRTSMGRRDPFVSVRKRPAVGTRLDPGENRPYQENLLANLVEMVEALRDGLTFQEELQKRGDVWRLQAQIKENSTLFQQLSEEIERARKEISIPELVDRLKKEVIEPFEEIRKRMEEIIQRNPPLPLERVQEWRDKIAGQFDERQWQDVDQEVRNFLDMSKGGQHVVEDARHIVVDILEFQRSARVIRRFEKRRIVISTILYSANQVSVAVINNKIFSEGDALDADGQVIVLEIGENFVIFETEGVEIKKTQNR